MLIKGVEGHHLFFRTHLFDRNDVYLLGGDERVVRKAGKHTHGLDRFFSSLAGKAVPGLACFTLSLISTKQRRSFPIQVAQVLRADKPASPPAKKRKPGRPHADSVPPASAAVPKRKPGRPKGSKTKLGLPLPLSPELQRIGTMLGELLCRMGGLVPVT